MSNSDDDGCAVFIVGAFAMGAIFVVCSDILTFLGMYWQSIVGWGIAIAFCWGAFVYTSKKMKEKRSRIQAQRIAGEREAQELRSTEAEEIRQRELAVTAKAAVSEFAEYLTPCLIIDSNIWMNEEYDAFFSILYCSCHRRGYKLRLFGPQFDEISNIKKATKFGDARNKRSRIAIHRIEEFQKQNLLQITQMTIDAKRGAYADPLLVKLIITKAREGKECTFFSNDKELRIRVRQHLGDYAEADWKIVEIASIMPKCREFYEAQRLGLLK